MKKRNIILILFGGIITASAVAGVLVYRNNSISTATSPVTFAFTGTPQVTTYPIPATILPIIQRLGIDSSLATQIQITTPPDNSICKGGALVDPSACENKTGIVFPSPLLLKTIVQQNAMFGHEWLHYAWSITSPADKAMLTPYIEQAYQNAKPYLDTRIEPYHLVAGQDDLRINELHSYIGTEIADSLIPQPLLDHYKKYLPNRAALPSMYPYPVIAAPPLPVPVQPLFIPNIVLPPSPPMCVTNYTFSSVQDDNGFWSTVRTPTGTTCY